MTGNVAVNRSRLATFINGITGIAPGASAIVNLPVNQRYHRLIYQCLAVNYTGGTAMATTNLTGSGTGATVTPTIVNGQVTAGTIVAGGSGYSVGNTFTVTDATGKGVIFQVATVSSGAVATVTVTSGGIPSPINPATMLSQIKISVNGVNMRDISPAQVLAISQCNGYLPVLGELPIFFTAPWRNVNFHNEVNSWDTFGQNTFSMQFVVSSTVVNPQLVGIQEYDYFRNLKPSTAQGAAAGSMVPFLQPVSQHSFSIPIPAGVYSFNTLPFDYPISRMFLSGSSPGNITELEVLADNNKVLETMTMQNQQLYGEYNFVTNPAGNSTIPNGTISAAPFDMLYISDPDQRYFKALKCANSLIVRVTSTVAQTLTVIQETLPGAYQA